MKEININIRMMFCVLEELPEQDRELIAIAKKATANAYAEYSHFHVGAALRLANGHVVTGANQENAAYPSGLCAERSAIFAAQSQYPEQAVDTLAIAACNNDGFLAEPITPCGACRQVILGIEDRYKRPIRILLYGTNGVYCIDSIKDLMPLAFVDSSMHNE
ncbi:MAG: cytidine deaminase [Prevotella sp.]